MSPGWASTGAGWSRSARNASAGLGTRVPARIVVTAGCVRGAAVVATAAGWGATPASSATVTTTPTACAGLDLVGGEAAPRSRWATPGSNGAAGQLVGWSWAGTDNGRRPFQGCRKRDGVVQVVLTAGRPGRRCTTRPAAGRRDGWAGYRCGGRRQG